MSSSAPAAASRPTIIPSIKKGILIKLLVAPTYFMMLISLRLAKTLALVVFEMIIRQTTTSATMTAKATIVNTLLILIRISANAVGDFVESTLSKVSI